MSSFSHERPIVTRARSTALKTAIEAWPIAGSFTISRGSKTQADVVVVELSDGAHRGRGECTPYPRYGETAGGVLEAIEALRQPLLEGLDRAGLQRLLPAGAARNGLDCAFWDLEAKQSGRPAYVLAGLPAPGPVNTAYTISLGTSEAMAQAAAAAAARPLLKIKLGSGNEDPARIRAIRSAAPTAELIVDANEGWTPDNLANNLAACAEVGVTLIEQPLPAADDAALAAVAHPIPICADESVHDRGTLARLKGKYEAVNIKLDKAGGLTEALALAEEATRLGFAIMVGSMVATSLAVAPAMLLAGGARVVDLDGPLLLAKDRPEGLRYKGSRLYPPEPVLWG
jgi:L-alanine-DL-glutamate epimerase-like enolase superfamily enzyme